MSASAAVHAPPRDMFHVKQRSLLADVSRETLDTLEDFASLLIRLEPNRQPRLLS